MNPNIKEALDKIIEKDLSGMRDSFSSALSSKAVQKLEERKVEIGKAYFGLKD
jgi:hypothetical protein